MKKLSLKLLSAVCALLLLASTAVLFVSCNDDKESDESTETPAGSESESASETSSGTSDETPKDLTLFENGKTEYTLVRPDKGADAVVSAANTLYAKLLELSADKNVGFYTDFVHKNAPITDKEILIGKTEREESISVYEELESVEGDRYLIKTVNEKVVIAATNVSMMDKAVEYFISAYLATGADKITVSASESYMSDRTVQQPYDVIDAVKGTAVANAVKLGSLSKDKDYKVAQGGCTDGRYIYIILENQNTGGEGYKKESHYGKLCKIDVRTMALVKISEPLPIDHGNDCTYNADTNEIVIAHNSPNSKYISFVDADTLELKKTDKNNAYNMYAIAYNSNLKKYVVGLSGGYDYAVYDNYPMMPKRYASIGMGYTRQGMDCDDKYIYLLQYKKNVITVYDWSGNCIKNISIENVPDEPEAIFHIDGQLYITSNRGGSTGGSNIYRIDITSAS